MSGFIPKRVRQGYLGTKRNQTGLKTQGSPAMIGRSNILKRYVKSRVCYCSKHEDILDCNCQTVTNINIEKQNITENYNLYNLDVKWGHPQGWFQSDYCKPINLKISLERLDNSKIVKNIYVHPSTTAIPIIFYHLLYDTEYVIKITTSCTDGENVTITSNSFSYPKPLPPTPPQPTPTCSSLDYNDPKKWLGTLKTHPINGFKLNWGFSIMSINDVSKEYIDCTKNFDIEIYNKNVREFYDNSLNKDIFSQGKMYFFKKCVPSNYDTEPNTCKTFPNLKPDTSYTIRITVKTSSNNSLYKTIDVSSGHPLSPPTPSPPSPLPPIELGDMPELFVTMYGSSFLKVASELLNDPARLSDIIENTNSRSNPDKIKESKIKQLSNWYWIRKGCNVFFNKYITFLTDVYSVRKNVKNAMISVGDFRMILPPRMHVEDHTKPNTFINDDGIFINPDNTTACPSGCPWKLGKDLLQYVAPNGPLDYGLPYSFPIKDFPQLEKWCWEDGHNLCTNDSSSIAILAVKKTGCPLILDFIIPLAKKLQYYKEKTDKIEINLQFSVTPTGASRGEYLSWDVGNYYSDDLRMKNAKNQWVNSPNGVDVILGYYNQYNVGKQPLDNNSNGFLKSNGNIYIGDGTNGTPNSQGYGCGRSSYFVESPGTNIEAFPKIIDANTNSNSSGIYKYGSFISNKNSFPLDNLHQTFITIYYINEKIMKLNYYIEKGMLKFAPDWSTSDLLPLITHVHSDSESAKPYSIDGPYPKCDTSGNLVKVVPIVGQNSIGLGSNLSDSGGLGYWKYLYNKYMPAECLPSWRCAGSQPGGSNNMSLTPLGIKVPHSQDTLWDNNKPWFTNQQRNFHEEPSSNKGYMNNTNNFNSTKKDNPYDGIQRYNIGSINTKTTASQLNSEGIYQAWQELYNIGEVKPPGLDIVNLDTGEEIENKIGISTPSKKLPASFYNITREGKKLSVSYNNTSKDGFGTNGSYALPKKQGIDNQQILDIPQLYPKGSNDGVSRLGSGCFTGNSPPLDITSMEIPKHGYATPVVGYQLTTLYNSLYARIAKKYKMDNINNFLGYSQIKGMDICGCSPAMTDLFLRNSSVAGPVPLDGRGFTKVEKNYPAPKDFSNSPKSTDGYYLPIDISFVSTTGINISDVYINPSTSVQGQDWNTINNNNNGSGPQEAIATFSFEYFGGALTTNPTKAAPYSEPDGPFSAENGEVSTIFNNNTAQDDPGNEGLSFTRTGKTISTDAFGDMITYDKKSESPWTLKSWSIGNTKSWTQTDKNNFQQGWDSGANNFGGEANLLSVLQDDRGFIPMKNFLIAAGLTMGGEKYYNKTKVGLYSIEFLPNSWLSEAS